MKESTRVLLALAIAIVAGVAIAASGNASLVRVENHGAIATSGYGSTAIFAQSIGGGGGEALGFYKVVDSHTILIAADTRP